MERCPHCRVKLPAAIDAFCPECREPLEDAGKPPVAPPADAPRAAGLFAPLNWLVGWFRSKPECPIDAEMRRWVDHRWRWLVGEFGVDRVREARLILPTPEFFPDPYRGTEEDARRVLDRVCGYMGIDPGCIEMSLYDDQSPLADHPMFGGRSQGTAGLYQPEGGRYRIWIEATNLDDPLGMVATVAHEVGHIHLLGHGRISAGAQDHEPLTDLLTVFFGLGVFTANSVIREQYWQDGQYAGWRIGRRGYLTMPVFGYALALFARTRGEDGSAWSGELRPDVCVAFKKSMRFLSAEAADRGKVDRPDSPPRPEDVLSSAEYRNYRNVRAAAVLFAILGIIMILGGIWIAVNGDPGRNGADDPALAAGVAAFGLAGAVGGVAALQGSRPSARLAKMSA
jgi:hypothetical protein